MLDINSELLYESVQLQASRAELKKEKAAADAGEATTDTDYAEEEKQAAQDYNQ